MTLTKETLHTFFASDLIVIVILSIKFNFVTDYTRWSQSLQSNFLSSDNYYN